MGYKSNGVLDWDVLNITEQVFKSIKIGDHLLIQMSSPSFIAA